MCQRTTFRRRPPSPYTYRSGVDPSFFPKKGMNWRVRHADGSVRFGALNDVHAPSSNINHLVGGLAPHCGGMVSNDRVYHGPTHCHLGDAPHDDVSCSHLLWVALQLSNAGSLVPHDGHHFCKRDGILRG